MEDGPSLLNKGVVALPVWVIYLDSTTFHAHKVVFVALNSNQNEAALLKNVAKTKGKYPTRLSYVNNTRIVFQTIQIKIRVYDISWLIPMGSYADNMWDDLFKVLNVSITFLQIYSKIDSSSSTNNSRIVLKSLDTITLHIHFCVKSRPSRK